MGCAESVLQGVRRACYGVCDERVMGWFRATRVQWLRSTWHGRVCGT